VAVPAPRRSGAPGPPAMAVPAVVATSATRTSQPVGPRICPRRARRWPYGSLGGRIGGGGPHMARLAALPSPMCPPSGHGAAAAQRTRRSGCPADRRTRRSGRPADTAQRLPGGSPYAAQRPPSGHGAAAARRIALRGPADTPYAAPRTRRSGCPADRPTRPRGHGAAAGRRTRGSGRPADTAQRLRSGRPADRPTRPRWPGPRPARPRPGTAHAAPRGLRRSRRSLDRRHGARAIRAR